MVIVCDGRQSLMTCSIYQLYILALYLPLDPQVVAFTFIYFDVLISTLLWLLFYDTLLLKVMF